MDQYDTPVVSSEDANPNVTTRRRRMLTKDPLDEIADGQENTTTGLDDLENQVKTRMIKKTNGTMP